MSTNLPAAQRKMEYFKENELCCEFRIVCRKRKQLNEMEEGE